MKNLLIKLKQRFVIGTSKQNKKSSILNKLENILTSIFRLIKIQIRLLVFFILLSSVPLIIIGFFSYSRSSKAIESNIEFYSFKIAEQSGHSLRSAMKNVESGCEEFLNYNEVKNSIKEYHAKMLSESEIFDIINGRMAKKYFPVMENCAGSIVFFGDKVLATTGAVTDAFFDKKLAQIAESGKGNSVWLIMDLPENSQNYILMVKEIYNNTTNVSIGSIALIFEDGFFSDIYGSIDLPESTDLFIINKNGLVVSSNNVQKVQINKKYLPDENVKSIVEASKTNYSLRSQIGDETYLVSYSPISDTDWYIVSTIPIDFLEKDSKNIRDVILFTGLILFLIAVVISYIISRSISSPLRNLEVYMSKAANGDLDICLNDNYKDEISSLSNNFDNMINKIKTLVSKVSVSSKRVLESAENVNQLSSAYYASSEQIAQSTHQIADGAVKQAEDSYLSLNFVSSLSNDINSVGSDMNTVSEIIYRTKILSENAIDSVKSLNEKSFKTRESTEDIVNNIHALNNDMKEIEKIIKFIGNISEQTNLLSLNAAIEAAKAGEAGRGFAVVATHVKKLAEQTKNSLSTVNTIINNIQKKTELVTSSTNNTQIIINQQMDAVSDTDTSFKSIFNSMEEMDKYMKEFQVSVNKILESKQNTITAISNISAVSEETAATIEQVSASAQQQMDEIEQLTKQAVMLNKMAQELRDSISNFNI